MAADTWFASELGEAISALTLDNVTREQAGLVLRAVVTAGRVTQRTRGLEGLVALAAGILLAEMFNERLER